MNLVRTTHRSTLATHTLAGTFLALAGAATLLVACGNDGSTTPKDDVKPGTTQSSLVFKSPCTSSSCPSAPTSDQAGSYTCAEVDSACSWSANDPNGSVSYRECDANECAIPAVAIVCPEGTHELPPRCGSENGAACAAYFSCAPDKTDGGATTDCADPDACGPIPDIAEICEDGTSRGLVCRSKNGKCAVQSGCPEYL